MWLIMNARLRRFAILICKTSPDSTNSSSQLAAASACDSAKIVRFDSSSSGKQQRGVSAAKSHSSDQFVADADSDAQEVTCGRYTGALLASASCLLAVYLAFGAYLHARFVQPQATLVDGLYSSFCLLTASRLPEAAGATKQSREQGWQTLAVQMLYLWVGLNLVSMCAHLARLVIGDSREEATEEEERQEQEQSKEEQALPSCNGHLPSLVGTLHHHHASPADSSAGSGGGGGSYHAMQQVPPETYGLAELYVVAPESSQAAALLVDAASRFTSPSDATTTTTHTAEVQRLCPRHASAASSNSAATSSSTTNGNGLHRHHNTNNVFCSDEADDSYDALRASARRMHTSSSFGRLPEQQQQPIGFVLAPEQQQQQQQFVSQTLTRRPMQQHEPHIRFASTTLTRN